MATRIQPGRFEIHLNRGDWWARYSVVRLDQLEETTRWLARSRKGQPVMISDRESGQTAILPAEEWPGMAALLVRLAASSDPHDRAAEQVA